VSVFLKKLPVLFSFALILNFSPLILIGLSPEGAATGANERQHESLQRGGLQDDDWYGRSFL
jgi:hypothetical protein